MQGFELFVFLLCLTVLIALVGFFTALITIIARQQLRLIRNGHEDARIKKDAIKRIAKSGEFWWNIIDKIVSTFLCVILILVLVISLVLGAKGDNRVVKGVPSFKVVSSTSMAVKYEKNEYLFENDLNNQVQLLDLVILHELPKEEDVKLYDVIVYETLEGALVIHRVIGIEEPNEKHPNERWFQFKGDATENPDRFPVRYSQMKSIYLGERIPTVGSFVFFMQSPAGTICIMVVLLALLITPLLGKKFEKEEDLRIKYMLDSGEIKEEDLTKKNQKKLKKQDGKNEKV